MGRPARYPLTVTVTDANDLTAAQSFTLTVTETGPTFTSAASTTFTENTAGTFSVVAAGDPTVHYTMTGVLPNAVTLSSSGVLSGNVPTTRPARTR